jgi:predicted murein hydrolase (TIGR00659 family)
MNQAKELIVSNPLFGITLSILVYVFFSFVYKKTRLTILNPLFLTILMICGLLLILNISFADYNQGGRFITLLLSPATVVLAVPLYDQLDLIKKNAATIFVSIAIGSLTSMLSVIAICRLFSVGKVLTVSLVPKSVTTAIAIDVSAANGGIKAVTVLAVLLTGVFGSVAGPWLCRFFRIKSRVAVGLAMGTASHALGTAKAIELGEDEGAMSSLAVSVAGIITVLTAPVLISLLMRIWS